MHMADALLSPVVGGTMMAVTVGVAAYSIKKIQQDPGQEDSKVPLMGVMGAFVFSAQMINFSIPGTGSSGHLGGGLMLAILLGPFAAFLTMASVLFIQALFFGDGGLLAYGANVFNLGFVSCFIAYPLLYRPLTKKGMTTGRMTVAAIITAIVGLQLGAFSVVIETLLSGKTALPFGTFVLFMQPIHLAIGIVEGIVTAAVIGYVWNARPELLYHVDVKEKAPRQSKKHIYIVLILCVVVMGAGVSLLASSYPDGLEWSIGHVTGSAELVSDGQVHGLFASIQEKLAFLPDYQFKDSNANETLGTSISGLVGGFSTLVLVGLIGLVINYFSRKNKKAKEVQ